MDTRDLDALEYQKVIEQIQPFASSRLGREKVRQLLPVHALAEVEEWLAATEEGVEVLRLKDSVPLGGIRDIRPLLKRASIGSVLTPSELLDIAGTISSGRRLKRFLLDVVEKENATLPIITRLAGQITNLKHVEEDIERVIDDHGEIVDHASERLRTIRSAIRQTERDIRDKLEQMLRSTRYKEMLQEAIVTLRGERYVVPVKQEYRSQFGGTVHDQSASGATLFIEPDAVVSLNHRLREWRLQEEREVERLLKELTAKVAEVHDELQGNVTALGELDFIFAKAAYARHVNATRPRVNVDGVVRLKRARHPLIPDENVVPIDVDLGDQYTALVVTGPNTGGKTVTLKTIGLLTLMAMSGLFIPVEEESEVAVFDNVFADIGDEQSIEQNLSTFSGHMTNIVRILTHLSPNSLVLLDELGAGTDPTEGAALAIALLDDIQRRGCRVVATTHYSELKAYAYNRENVMNASVEFDVETLSPTYRLRVGVPGKSNAFAIAERLGLPRHIIKTAQEQLGADDNSVENMIVALEFNRKKAEGEREAAAALRREAEALKASVERAQRELERERERLRMQAEMEAREIVKKAKREADAVIGELRQLKSTPQNVKDHQLIEVKKRLDAQEPEVSRPWKRAEGTGGKRVKHSQLKPGDEVYVRSLNQKGHVADVLSRDDVQVQLGLMKVTVPIHDVELVQTPGEKEAAPMTSVTRAAEDVRPELDLRGSTVEEAIIETDKYLDDAVLNGLQRVSIIHGKGTGALRTGIHNYLKSHRHVKQFRLGRQGEGGSGVTVVELGES